MNSTRQNQAEPDIPPEQELALTGLLAGETDEKAATAAGVTRQTVNGWKNHDPAFIAELNRRRAELWESHHDRLRALVGRAAAVLEGSLGSTDGRIRLAAAVALLKYGPDDLVPKGPRTVLAAKTERMYRTLLDE